jgi:hypothetical protein
MVKEIKIKCNPLKVENKHLSAIILKSDYEEI